MKTYLLIIIYLISILSSFPVLAKKPLVKFEHLTIKEGLSQSTVYCILQDSTGFMWFGTQDGLNKYDGYEFTVYRHHPQDPNSLSHNEVFALYEDSQGILWIGTRSGLNQFDSKQNKFIHYSHNPQDSDSLSHDEVWSIYEDNHGILWIGTNGGGLNQFNRQDNTFVHFQHDPQNSDTLSHNTVWPIYHDKKGVLWIGTDGGGLNQFDPQTNQFKHYLPDSQEPDSNAISTIYEDQTGLLWIGTIKGLYQFDRQQERFTSYFHNPKNPNSLSHNTVLAIIEDNLDRLWIATDGGGLNLFDRRTQQFEHFKHDSQNPTGLNNDAVLSLYKDAAGSLWVGTGGGGINQFNQRLEKFVHYFHDPKNPNSLNKNHVLSILEDRDGLLWVGTQGGGLNQFDRHAQKVTHYLHDAQNFNSLSHDDVWSLAQDSSGTLWVGTFGGGLNRFDRELNNFVSYRHAPDEPTSLINDYVLSIYEDSTKTLWIGTREGLEQFDRQTNRFIHYLHDPQNPNSLSDNSILSIFEDHTQTLWIGTTKGLNRFDQNKFVRYQHDAQNPISLSHNEISTIYEDKTGTLWIGTWGGGLNKFDRETERFYAYREADGLVNNVIYGILEDQHGNLWLSSNKGISKFNPKMETFRNYNVLDGLQSNEFNSAYYKSSRDELFFGGINGFNAFYPERTQDNPYIPPIVITDFKIFNKSVSSGNDSPLQQHINRTHEMILSYKQSFFSFEFAALNFLRPEENEYAYQLEGFNKDWNKIGSKREANYTNVPHGTYQFRVKGSNNDKVWNEQGTTIKITILPPPWQTWWAYTLYVIIILTIIISYVRLQKQKLREKQQELEREKAIAAQLKEADRLKDEFLANTSHELRTPLNGIIGIAESLVDGAAGALNASANTNLGMIASSGRRLMSLVNDILDFSRLKQKELDLQLKTVDIRTIAEIVLKLSQPLIGQKEVQLINAIPADLPSINADENRVQQILYNLVGNAIKFTDSGKIEISAKIVKELDSSEERLAITISDTGIGIAEEKVGRIFEAFEQADGSTARIYGGTGLGLAVTQQLVQLHGGQMQVQSQLGEGSQFTFTLPLSTGETDSKSLSSPIFSDLSSNIPENTQPPVEEAQSPEEPQLAGVETTIELLKIFIVDDDAVNRQVLINHLSLQQNYALTQASSGVEALALMKEGYKPDLILLDVMMPHLSGYEVTEEIRQTQQANELPILLLTAKNQTSDLVTGLEVGANDYLTKPVFKEELLARIKTHLNIQQLKAENLRMSAELDVTRRLQQMILPNDQELEQVAGLEIAGFMEPTEEVGGDYYDVLQHEGCILFGIGDVTGHGLESGVLMLMAQTAVRTLLESEEKDPVKFLNILNRTIYKNVQQRMGVDKNLTLSLLEYVPHSEKGGILHISGQHEELIILRKDGTLERIDTIDLGFPIGIVENITKFIAQMQVPLNPGDVVVLYTDGITEAGNEEDELYGMERFCELIQQYGQKSVHELCQAIIDDVRQHIGNNRLLDDITLLIIKQK